MAEEAVSFHVKPAGDQAALAAPAPRSIPWSNAGGGTLQLKADADAYPWISASVVGGQVRVGLDTDGLAPGFYSGVVRLKQVGGDPLIGKPQCIRVKAWVYPSGASPAPGRQMFLPYVIR